MRIGSPSTAQPLPTPLALSRGGEYADLFFQHRIGHNFVLEDGSVNRAFKGTELGVGVRVVKGDQTGYAFTEDLSLQSIRQAARTAAAIAEGGPGDSPSRFHLTSGLPSRNRRYVSRT